MRYVSNNNTNITEISVKIELNKKTYKAEDQEGLKFTLINNSDNELSVLKWKTPLDGINSDMFNIEKEGEKSVYLGRIVKRGTPKPEDYVKLAPGESISKEFDLTNFYDISSVGNYNIQFISPLLDIGMNEPETLASDFAAKDDIAPKIVYSNVVQFQLLENRTPKQSKGIALDWIRAKEGISDTIGPSFRNCELDRQDILKEALSEARIMANEAKLFLINTNVNNQRYKEWFGNYDDQRYANVIVNFEKIWDAVANKNIIFNCECEEEGSVYAYVYPTRPYEIYLCNLFWNAPVIGTDSRAGTIIHELSHFDILADTNDIVYGQTRCRLLAINDPARTLSNADNHEYFAENNPLITN
jgi:peptidyl-Lys metalloendopeptidase